MTLAKTAAKADDRKIYLGARLRRLRERLGFTQAAFAQTLEISPSYLNQIEHEHRPITWPVLQRLGERFNVDLTEFSETGADRLVAELKDMLADPLFAGTNVSLRELRTFARSSPGLAQGYLILHRAYRQAHDDYRTLAEKLAGDERVETREGAQFPYEEVRDYFYYRSNYIDGVDRAAEELAKEIGLMPGRMESALAERLNLRHGVAVNIFQTGEEEALGRAPLRFFDADAKTLKLADVLTRGERAFQIAYHLGRLEQQALFDRLVASAALSSEEAGSVLRMGLANYFAGALLMPYGLYHGAAEELRYDIERLEQRFGVTFEQAAHRLSTLQRARKAGVPFYFLRVDQAGNISKRASAAEGFHFARAGGTCPLWNVHEAFTRPGEMLRQVAQMPDGTTYLCLARTVTKGGAGFHAPRKRFAIGIGCEIAHAHKLIYAEGMDLDNPGAPQPIGASCRVCERPDCAQRAFPPIGKAVQIEEDARRFTPFVFD